MSKGDEAAGAQPEDRPGSAEGSPAELLSSSPGAYWSARLRENFTLGGVGNLPLGRSFNEWAYRARRRALVRALKRFAIPTRHADVLEVGFGTGFFVDFWSARPIQSLTGLDITRKAVDELTARHPAHRFHQQDIGAEHCPAYGSFDIVTVFDVLFHLLDDRAFERAMDNVGRHVRPGGFLLLTDVFARGRELRGPTQFSRRLEDYEAALSRNRFSVMGFQPIFFTMSRPVDVSGWSAVLLGAWWRALTSILGAAPASGHVVGPLCFAIDSCCQRLARRGPSVKLLVARRLP